MKILAIGAHLDDIELACGGTLAKAVLNKHQVKTLILTKSGYTDINGHIQRSNQTAIDEGIHALGTLGITDFEILDFPTKDIPFSSEVITEIEKRILNFSPNIIFCHHPFDTYQAHERAAKSTIAAARRQNSIMFFEPISPSGKSYVAFKPQVYVDITQTIDKKIMSLRQHVSEYNKYGKENWIDGITARANFRGYEIGCKYAESFELLRCELGFNTQFQL